MDRSVFQPDAPGQLVRTEVPGRVDPLLGTVPARTVWAFVPDPLPPKAIRAEAERAGMIGRLYPDLERALINLLHLESAVGQLPNPQILLSPMRQREVQSSSTIENTVAAIEELAREEAGLASANPASAEVANNLRAVNLAIESPLPMCNRLLLDAHRTLMTGVRGGDQTPGEFRNVHVHIGSRAVGIGDARFVPPPPGEALRTCLDAFERALNPSPGAETPPSHTPWLIDVAFAHYQFEAIHPFRDGNGRLGRLLVNVAPVKSGRLKFPILHVSEFFAAHKDAYMDALLRVSTHADWEGWARLFLRAVAAQSQTDLFRAQTLLAIRDALRNEFANARTSVLVHLAIDFFFMRPVASIRQLANYLVISAPAAGKHVERLVAAGFLREITGRAVARYYAAGPIIDAIERSPELTRDTLK
jgi:Fic family protein